MRPSHKKSSRFLGVIAFFLAFLCVFASFYALSKRAPSSSLPTLSDTELPTVIIDAGHGGEDGGAIGHIDGREVYEKDINLSIVKNLGSLLTLSGYDVVYTRTEDISIYDNGVEGIRNQKISDMKNRLEIVERYPESIFLSIHPQKFLLFC